MRPALLLAITLVGSPGCDAPPELTRLSAGAALYVAKARLWPGPTIPVCWENPSPTHAAERALVRSAIEGSWGRAAALRFSGFGACAPSSRGVRVRVADTGPHTLGLGTEIDGKPDGMVLNFSFETWSPGCKDTRPFCIRAGAIHEFGHALGFAHEQNRPDTPDWCKLEQGSPGDALVGPWDLASIMNYCNPRWTGDGELSPTDILGARAAYGSGGGDLYLATATDAAFAAPGRSALGVSAAPSQLLLADVTGDGRADAVLFYSDRGDWWVAPSTGAGFAAATRWRSGHGQGGRALLADVTGDGRADAVAYFADSGDWWVAPSTGASFGAYARWQTRHGQGATAAFLGDVSGDGRADAVVFYDQGGAWWVAPSTGALFGAYSRAASGHGQGAVPLLGDVTGDGRADAVVFSTADGGFSVAPAFSTVVSGAASFGGFATARSFGAGLFRGARALALSDVTGDGRADAVAFSPEAGGFSVAPALGSAQVGGGDHFGPATEWVSGHGTSLDPNAVLTGFGDANGDRRADAAVLWRR